MYIDFKWQNTFSLESNLNRSTVYGGNDLSLKCSFRKLLQAESLTKTRQSPCFAVSTGMWRPLTAVENAEAAVINWDQGTWQLRLRISAAHKERFVVCSQVRQYKSTSPYSQFGIQKCSKWKGFTTHLPPELNSNGRKSGLTLLVGFIISHIVNIQYVSKYEYVHIRKY